MQQIVIIGKLYERNKLNGPGNVIFQLQQAFSKLNVDVKYILNNESNSFFSNIRSIIVNVLFKKGLIVNVHTDGFILALFIYLISLFNRKNSYYLTVHGIYKIESEMSETTKIRYLILEKFLYQRFSNLICVSSKLAKDIELIYGRNRNVNVVNNGVHRILSTSFQSNKITDGNIDFIFVGGINKRKGTLETLQVFKYLVDNLDINVHLNIYGAVENKKIKGQYQQYIENHNLEEYITYHGLVYDKSELLRYYANSTFHLCLSLYDTFNVAVLESMSVGCPCILSDRCGAKDIITNKENGYIVAMDENLEDTIFKIIQEVRLNSEKLKQLKSGSRMTANNNTWDVVASKYYKLFERNT
ncbi:glycosyltransferase family 4 protein [Priestia megaterium]|uniref:glycosyltransferase family 4 protein n=1 Tax=Priestia megaterium TaxID=1404 RepID=UPI0020A0EBD3|nr:glycosyltransferase family 4 protein [Priestia megaterium]MCP1450456.1 glycosyltransferase involved in cell wall biosynthesis [Priestia megaterium]